ncbi:UNVERIFIED_CONTAM: ProQ/FINO family protein [Kocuria sp. CPCC 205274]
MLIYVKAVHYDFYKRRIDELVSAFPHAFNKQFPHPLAIGIHKQLEERTGFSPKEISVLLRIWTHRIEYLSMGCSVGSRVDLDGNLTLISADHIKGFVAAHEKMSDHFVKRFSKHFLKVYGRPAFIAVPISQRKEISFAEEEESSGDSGSN